MNPIVQPPANKPLIPFTRKQRRMILYAFSGVVVITAGIWVFYWVSSAQQRAQEQFQVAMKSMKPGFYQEAITGFDRAINTYPALADAYYERGNAEHILGRDDQALADFEKAVDVNPNLYRAYAELGSIYRGRNDLRRAMEMFTKSIQAKPNVDAFYERGITYESLGEHQKAIEDYDRAILESPDAPALYRARSLARREVGDEAGYQADRDRASEIDHGK
jgi:tetratricopeptide (TPR) repeat protein